VPKLGDFTPYVAVVKFSRKGCEDDKNNRLGYKWQEKYKKRFIFKGFN